MREFQLGFRFGRALAGWIGLGCVLLPLLLKAATTPGFAPGVVVGTVTSGNIWEASGLLASRQNPGVLWTHNDSGFRGSVFALGTNGDLLAQFYVPDLFSGDFEDIAYGPGPEPQFHYIFLGDIGDNFLVRDSIRVFRFPEPAIYQFQSNAPVVQAITGYAEITLRYPDGPFNAEAMMLDPVTGDLFIATKLTNACRVYRATRAELESASPITLTLVATPSFRSASGADISADGSLVCIRRPGRGGLWPRLPGQSVADALTAAPITIPVIGQPTEPNGESIAFDPSALGYYTLSEGFNQPIYYFACTNCYPALPRVLVPPESEWDVNLYGYELPPGWTTNFNDVSYSGPAPLGFGGGESTETYTDSSTVYYAHSFSATNSTNALLLRVACNEGLAVYLNGEEIFRRRLMPEAVYDDFAVGPPDSGPRNWFAVPVRAALLRSGANVLAAEVHVFDAEPRSLLFDAQLLEGPAAFAATLAAPERVDGMFVGKVQGGIGLVVPLESSIDLRSWQPHPSVLLTNGLGTFQVSPGHAACFFRVRRPN